MHDHDDDDRIEALGTGAPPPGRAGRTSWLWAVLPGAILLLAAFLATPATSSEGRGLFGRGDRHGSMDPDRAKARTERAADWILATVDATDAQREDVLSVVGRTFDAMRPVVEQHRSKHDAWLAALATPVVDRAELERLRQEELVLANQASEQLLTAVADIANILTPEQRAKLVDLASRFHDRER